MLSETLMFFFPFLFFLRTELEWVNPSQYGLISIMASDGRNLPYGRLDDIISRDPTPCNCHTHDDR